MKKGLLPATFNAAILGLAMATVCLAYPIKSGRPPGVIDPSNFAQPNVKAGYSAAYKYPKLMGQLFCYCGCDVSEKHKALLDCFTCLHGVDCSICIDEAVMAGKLAGQGKTVAQIQQAVDLKFSHNYPFPKDTAVYKSYKANRLWKPDWTQSKPTSKPTTKSGSCCDTNTAKNDKK